MPQTNFEKINAFYKSNTAYANAFTGVAMKEADAAREAAEAAEWEQWEKSQRAAGDV